MKKYGLLISIMLVGIVSWQSQLLGTEELKRHAVSLSKKIMIIDAHIDLPYRLKESWEDVGSDAPGGHFDFPRAVKGGLNALFAAVFVPWENEKKGDAKAVADQQIDMLNGIIQKHPEKFARALSPNDLLLNFKKGMISMPFGIENGAPLEGKLENVQYYFDRGIRYITLCHSRDNHICDSSFDRSRTWKGLSPFGKKLIPRMNSVGMLIDVSHVSDDAFWQVIELSRVPVIATHSGCRHFTPGFERNMSDRMIRKLAEKGGVIHINFGSFFLETNYQKIGRKMWQNLSAYKSKHKLGWQDKQMRAYREAYLKKHPRPKLNIGHLIKHIDHVVKLVGIDHVGLGSDFDGIDDVPVGISDVSKYSNIIYELKKLGYKDHDIEKICSKNLLRVWNQVLGFAKKGK